MMLKTIINGILFVQLEINSTRDVSKFCQIGLAPALVQFWQNF